MMNGVMAKVQRDVGPTTRRIGRDVSFAAGIVVMGGTEHNTPDRIPVEVACVDGPVSDFARQAFWEATCVVAAHQHQVAQGGMGYVDASGERTSATVAELVELGANLIGVAK